MQLEVAAWKGGAECNQESFRCSAHAVFQHFLGLLGFPLHEFGVDKKDTL
jgi:hypothetical protein